MAKSVDADMLRIFTDWHDAVRQGDLARSATLYADNAVLETPLALAVYPEKKTGMVIGRGAILTFFQDSVRKFPNDFAQWYRTGVYFINGKQLTWEYPRAAPVGDQVDLMEMMEIDNGLIITHRVYWGWYGVKLLAATVVTSDVHAER